jgi:thioredoxin-related protein
MRFFSALFIGVLLVAISGWDTDFENAKKKAEKEHKYILLNFSGSDWCGPCIRLRNEIFENEAFIKYADNTLVLLNADFPRLKKNQLSKDQQKKNDELADKYDPGGIFPYTVLLSPEGKVIHAWEGLPPVTAEQFNTQIKTILDARN